MARKLKTYQTSLGFYDLAIAAPSMKAALEAWGAGSNLFHQGAARETDDPDVVAATMAKPGVILRRPRDRAGASLSSPACLPVMKAKVPENGADRKAKRGPLRRSVKRLRGKQPWSLSGSRHGAKPGAGPRSPPRPRSASGAKRHSPRPRLALDDAQRDHSARTAAIEDDRAAVEKRAQLEDACWEKQKEKLTAALRSARSK